MYNFKTKAMAALVLGMGLLSACSSNDEVDNGGSTVTTGSTYMSVAINLATNGGTRADNQEDTAGNPDYNFVGKWAGQDKVNAIDVYVFNAANQLEAYQKFSAGQFQVQGANAADNTVTVTPSKGIKVLPGAKTVYVVVNPTAETQAHLPSTLTTTTLAAFEEKYQNVADAPANFFKLDNSGNNTGNVETSASKLAKVDGNNDVITMTAIEAAKNVDVKENVSEAATLAGNTTNRAKLTVKRTVARVMVTTKEGSFEVKGDDPLTADVETDAVLGTVKNIKYVVAQGEQSIYLMQRAGGSAELTYKTPYSDYVINANNDNYTWDLAGARYDYSGLWKGYSANGIGGTEVPTKALYDANQNTALGKITQDLKKQLSGEFILPNTHKWGNTQDASGYRKGNTAYVLVRALFVPKKVVMDDGSISESYPEGQTFFMGANGVFYQSVTAAQDASAGKYGVANQKTSQYVNGKTLYYAWINPDNTTDSKWLNSPVNRNNIYHIQIDGFKRIGANWNPLVPNDPQHPNDPSDNPNNPDPKPKDPNEPNDPPVNPNDPLTPKETWMSVETKILPWNVHSYSVVLDM